MKPCSGVIFQIQRWSLHDGEGLRTTVFFKGCPLRCRWCANPESWHSSPEVLYYREKCRGCGQCLAACEAGAISAAGGSVVFNRLSCRSCLDCCRVCAAGARKPIGSAVTVDEVMQVIKRDAVFYRESGGGVTFSGGEPFAQPAFLRRLAKACQDAGIDTAVETSGYFEWEQAADIFPYLDYVFMDIKQMNDTLHKDLTGVSNRRILDNVARVSRRSATVVRVPLLEGINADEAHIRSLCEFLCRHTRVRTVELLPYHTLGEAKYTALGAGQSGFTAPSAGKIAALRELIAGYGLCSVDFK